jgi:hypothetical protein
MLADAASASPGTAAGRTDAYLDRIGADRVALRRVLDTFVDTPVEALGEIEPPVLLLFGDEEDEAWRDRPGEIPYPTFSIAASTSCRLGFSCSVSLPFGPSITIATP